jgi:hypothetical protein
MTLLNRIKTAGVTAERNSTWQKLWFLDIFADMTVSATEVSLGQKKTKNQLKSPIN